MRSVRTLPAFNITESISTLCLTLTCSINNNYPCLVADLVDDREGMVIGWGKQLQLQVALRVVFIIQTKKQ